jgi:hypothetical protein
MAGNPRMSDEYHLKAAPFGNRAGLGAVVALVDGPRLDRRRVFISTAVTVSASWPFVNNIMRG